ncbi:MAG: hypothetical protein ACOH14_01515 [Rhodoglobus sp.]
MFALSMGLLVFASFLALGTLDVFYGPLSFALAGLLLLGVPTARYFSRRLAINGIVLLGFGPLLWWIPWSQDWVVTHSSVLLGLGAGFITVWAISSAARARALVPAVRAGDVATLVTAAFVVWFFRPFYKYTTGLDSVSLLRQAFGGDNVAHFNMFEMIRRTGNTGPNWPGTLDGTLYAYEPYPQHFHALVAQVAELWAGAAVRTVDIEAGLFVAGSGIVVSLAVVTLVAAGTSLRAIRDRLGLSLLVAAGVISFLLLGFGSYALSYGFPPYLLAIIGTLIGLTLALHPGRSTIGAVVGSAAATVLVAHTWSLLAPLAGIGLIWCLLRLPWRTRVNRGRLVVFAAGVVTVVGAAGGWALYLVINATSTVGSISFVLSTPGASPAASIPLTVGLAVALVGTVLLLQQRRAALGGGWLIAIVAAVGIIEAALLIAVQLSEAGVISYFQIKFVNALFVLFSVLLVLMITLLVAESTHRIGRESLNVAGAVKIVTAVALVVVVSGLPVFLHPALASATSPGILFRTAAEVQAQTHLERTVRLVPAAQVMATQPCIRPIFLDAQVTDGSLDGSNQWAMSLSSTWTEASAPINAYLFSQNSDDNWETAPSVARHLLVEIPDSCLVVTPEVKVYLERELGSSSIAKKIVSW